MLDLPARPACLTHRQVLLPPHGNNEQARLRRHPGVAGEGGSGRHAVGEVKAKEGALCKRNRLKMGVPLGIQYTGSETDHAFYWSTAKSSCLSELMTCPSTPFLSNTRSTALPTHILGPHQAPPSAQVHSPIKPPTWPLITPLPLCPCYHAPLPSS